MPYYSSRPHFSNKYNPTYPSRVFENQEKPKWCANHVTGYVGVNHETGRQWTKCSKGFQLNEKCDLQEG